MPDAIPLDKCKVKSQHVGQVELRLQPHLKPGAKVEFDGDSGIVTAVLENCSSYGTYRVKVL